MAFGHAVKRGGFKNGTDEKIKGAKGDVGETLDGMDGDDVVIAFGGEDIAIGGDGEDDISGGGDNDLLIGAIWEDTDDTEGVQETDTFTQDEFSDDFNAEEDFDSNGSDTIWLYDGTSDAEDDPYDVIDLSDAVEFEDTDTSGTVEEDEMVEQLNAAFSYEDGALNDGDDNTWFTVYSDAGSTTAERVYVEVDGDVFVADSGGDFEMLMV